ncbi:MAG: TRAP transporter substrate-binding protein DctP [Treponema sp.]|jgi:TRAP-type C4-dicarboxylate transport system substrate-binding protein|nr:TRAP transporter substrate-binding protein DctP [Treponema sp.]
MKYRLFTAILLMHLLCGGVFAAPRKITIKLAASVPENTPWGAHLNKMAAEWRDASNGEVELKIYWDGTQGGEAAVLRKLKSNAIQAAIFSSFGLNEITPEVLTLSCPFLIRNDGELDAVLDAIKPELERKINSSKTFFMLAWSKVGWVKFFSKAPVYVPNDLKRQRLGANESDAQLLDAFKAMGYTMTPVAQNQILVSLSSGQIDAVYLSPVMAGGTQAFGLAKRMASLNVAPFLGAIVVNQTTWRRIPEQYRDTLLRIAKRHEAELNGAVTQLEAEIIETMQRHGLIVNEVTPEQAQLWYNDVRQALPKLFGSTFDKSTYDRIDAIVSAYRKRN